MKAFLLFSLASLFVYQVSAQSLSAEAANRKTPQSCSSLVDRKPGSGETSGSGEKASPPSPGSPPPPASPSSPPPPGQCVCTPATASPASGATQPGQNGVSTTPDVDYDCELTEALHNCTALLTGVEIDIWLEFIQYIEVNILVDVTLTDVEKVVACSLALQTFCEENVDIYYKIAFETIASWGFIIDFLYVSVDIQADITEQVVTLDSNDNCELFQAMLNATEGNSQQYQAVEVLIEELKVEVFLNVQLTYAQKLARCYEIFESFFAEYSQWESFFLSIEISGYGSLQGFVEVCHGYHKALTIYTVLSGSSDSDCVLLGALTNATANTSFSLSVRNQIKELHDKLIVFFDANVDINVRLAYVSAQCYQMFLTEYFIEAFLDMITLEVDVDIWGIFYDVLWCSTFCHNEGNCGDLGQGMGTTLPPATTTAASTVASSASTAASSAVSTASTQAPTTQAPSPNCNNRTQLIVITSSNTTILTDCLTQNYNSWNSSVRLGFNTCFNQVRGAIWNSSITISSRVEAIVGYFNNYMKNQPSSQDVLMNITVSLWPGTIRQFCACG